MRERFCAEPGSFRFRAELLADEQNEAAAFFPRTFVIIRLSHLGAVLIARRWTKSEIVTYAVFLANEKTYPSIRSPNTSESGTRGQGGVTSQASARVAFNVVGTNAIEDVHIAVDGKGEAVGLGDPDFPDVAARGVALTFHFLGSQGRAA
jgi:hypothetical protein